MLSPASIQNLHGQTATCDLKGHLNCLKWVQLARPSLAGSSFVLTSKDLYQQSLPSFDQLCQIQKSCLRILRRSLGSSCFRIHSSARLTGKVFTIPSLVPCEQERPNFEKRTRKSRVCAKHKLYLQICTAQCPSISYLGNHCTFLLMTG